jgi:hypothetical protein
MNNTSHCLISSKHWRHRSALTLVALTAVLAGCDPVSLTVLGVGTAAGIQHTLTGITYRTFTVPLPQVRDATIAAFNRMSIKVTARDKTPQGVTIKGTATGRDIEVELEALTASTTRMRTIVHNGVLMDSATGTEIIIQTERALKT